MGVGWTCAAPVDGTHTDRQLVVKPGYLQRHCDGYQRQMD